MSNKTGYKYYNQNEYYEIHKMTAGADKMAIFEYMFDTRSDELGISLWSRKMLLHLNIWNSSGNEISSRSMYQEYQKGI